MSVGSRRTAAAVVAGLMAVVAVLPAAPSAADGNETPGAPGPFRTISGGDNHTCAIVPGGTVRCWGRNSEGQLGLGDTTPRGDQSGEMGTSLPAVDLGSGRTATSISAGNSFTCALLDGGDVKCWGQNASGQLGQGDTLVRGDQPGALGDQLPPVDLGTGHTATAVTAGNNHACALLDDGTVKCWGRAGTAGILGLGDTASRGNEPGEMGDALPVVDLGAGRTAVSISTALFHTCALLDDGSVKCWGYNGDGALGLGDLDNRGGEEGEMGDALPVVDLGTGRRAVAISATGYHTCALLDDASVKCWGRNVEGQLGLGDTGNRGDEPNEMGDTLPGVDLGTAGTPVAVTTGARFSCALLAGGDAKCWGDNALGQLGQGHLSTRGDQPGEMGDNLAVIDLGAGAHVAALSAGVFHVCARLEDQRLKCWGSNDAGRLGLGDTAHRGDAPNEMGDALPAVDLTLALWITKSAAQTSVEAGEAIDYRLTVTNIASSSLSGVSVADAAAPDCAGPQADLAPAAQIIIECSYTTDSSDLGTYTNVATATSDQTGPVDSNPVDVDVVETRQPDLTVKRDGGPSFGDDLYNTTGEGQVARVGRNRLGRAVFFLVVQNDGRYAEPFSVRRIGADPGTTVRYFEGRSSTDITRAINRRTYTTADLPPAGRATIRVEISVTAIAFRGADHDVVLRAKSGADPGQADTAVARVHVH